MAKPLTQEQRDEILALHAEGLSRNEIARRTGISAGSVTNVCNENDRAFDRSQTKDASRARAADLAEARLNLAQRLNTVNTLTALSLGMTALAALLGVINLTPSPTK